MSKSCKSVPKTCCERYRRHLRAFANINRNKTIKDTCKKHSSNNSEKSCSTGIINKNKESKVNTPKKTTKSDYSFKNLSSNIDYCKNCGDAASKSNRTISSTKLRDETEETCKMPLNKVGQTTSNKYSNNDCQIRQFYKNENFKQSTHSFNMENLKKISLNTILEQSEKVSDTEKSIFEIYPESDEEITFMDPDDCENLKTIKEFRNKNYFECHSAKSRINKPINLNHECVYRFYLNERLFPVPLNTDCNDNIRCTECFLPLDKKLPEEKINGTIQAKVKMNDEVQDMLLMLPVKNVMIKEKRKEVETKEDEIYFGIIKLDLNGNSVFNRSLPDDSLALKYQKGYKEFSRDVKYEYESVGNNDVIII